MIGGNRSKIATPRISVVIPVYNGELYLQEALESVYAQTLLPNEVVVVDDGSTDRSADVARRFPNVVYVYQQRAGQARALNAGVALTSSEFLAFLDADDRWLPNKSRLQLTAFLHHPQLDLVFGHALQFTESGVRLSTRQLLPARLPSAMLARRSAWQRVGPFSEQWAIGGVIEWCARADDLGLHWTILDSIVYERRIHGKNSSLTCPKVTAEYASMLKYVLERRRLKAAASSTGDNSGMPRALPGGVGKI